MASKTNIASAAVDAVLDDIEIGDAVLGFRWDRPAGWSNPVHFHKCGQLVAASQGTLKVFSALGVLIVPPQRAIWVPSLHPHRVEAKSAAIFRTIYFPLSLAARMPDECQVLNVSPLLSNLMMEMVRLTTQSDASRRRCAVEELIVDDIAASAERCPEWFLPMPTDHRVADIVDALVSDPTVPGTREEWAKRVAASARTIDRIFKAECGVGFGIWRRQLRMMEAANRLATGLQVSQVAFDLGHESPSAFIRSFRATFGDTPGRFFSAENDSAESDC